MNPGKLRDEITLQSPAVVPQDNGQPITIWSDYATVLGNVTTPSVRQFRGASREIQQGANPRTMRRNEWLVQIRHDPDVSSAMRVTWLDHVLDIEGITADPKNSYYMFLHCYEIVEAQHGFGDLSSSPSIAITINGTEYADGDTYNHGELIAGMDDVFTVTIDNGEGNAALAIQTSITTGRFTESSAPDSVIMPEANTSATIFISNRVSTPGGEHTATYTIQSNDGQASSIAITLKYTSI